MGSVRFLLWFPSLRLFTLQVPRILDVEDISRRRAKRMMRATCRKTASFVQASFTRQRQSNDWWEPPELRVVPVQEVYSQEEYGRAVFGPAMFGWLFGTSSRQ